MGLGLGSIVERVLMTGVGIDWCMYVYRKLLVGDASLFEKSLIVYS